MVTQLTYYQGEKHGPYVYNYFTGATQSTGSFNHGELDGEVLGYYSTGILKYSVHYVSGVRQGLSKTWFKNGAPEQVANYVNDLPHGDVYEYYQDSILWSESEYKMGVRNGRYYQFHKKSGCPAVESYYKNGKLDSIRRVWNEINCQLIQEEHYLNGLKDGEFVLYDFTGDTLSVMHYKAQVLEGEYRLYYSKTSAESDQGVVLRYNSNKGIEAIGSYSAGKKQGFWKYGLTSNYQHREGNYEDDVMVGEWKFYDLKGRILMVQWYDSEGNITKEKLYKRPRKNK
jgi:antitoxin component YwqK of YwqJK toxin-antitoxin module